MNTSQITTQITNSFIDQFGIENFFAIIAAFRLKASTQGLTSLEHILYNKIRNLPLKRGFTPIKKPIRLANGHDPYDGYKWAESNLKSMLHYKNKDLETKFKITNEMQAFLSF